MQGLINLTHTLDAATEHKKSFWPFIRLEKAPKCMIVFLPILIFHCMRRGSSIAEESEHKLLQHPENDVLKESITCTVY